MTELRKDLVQDLVESCKREHSDASSSFAALDLKAQNTITVAGIFLAGALVFFRSDTLQQFVAIGSKRMLVLLGLAVLPLMLSIGSCILAMWVREVSIENTVLSVNDVQRIFKLPAESLPEMFEVHMFDQAAEWNRLSSEIRDANDRKADKIWWGQLSLAIAIGFAAALLFLTLYTVWTLPPKT